jgi:hypothetical protein
MREQSMPSVIVDPLSGSAGATSGQVPPSAGTQAMVTIAVASPWQTPPTTGEKGSASILGAALAPRVLRRKVFSVKKSNL